jgi:beta-glucosidase
MTTKIELPQGFAWPKDFLWGVSTSAYQIEGATQEDGRGPSIWDIHCRIKGRVNNGDTGDLGADHYHRYAEDIALMKQLGVGAYRFSVAWPRVLPKGRGQINPAGLDFYDRLIDGALEAGIEPWLCLYHWDLPQGLAEFGGWTNRDVSGWFADYAALIARRTGDRVKNFITFNEPNVSTLFGYGMTWAAPAANDWVSYLRAVHHLNMAHGKAVDVVRSLVPGASIGVVHNRQAVRAEGGAEENQRAAQLLDAHWNRIFVDPQFLGFYPPEVADDIAPYVQGGDMAIISRPVDWFGLNHYGPIFAKAAPPPLGFAWGCDPDAVPHPDLGWTIYPDAFREELLELTRRYRLPIYVTENGCGSDREVVGDDGRVLDTHRLSYLRTYVAKMAEAMQQGADVRGYFVWSLLDNFEWGSGYGNRFGLVHVDFADNCKRTPKHSFDWYNNLILTGGMK